MIAVEIVYVLVLSVIAVLGLQPMGWARRGASRTRALSIVLPGGGEIEVSVRTAVPLSSAAWRSLRSSVEVMARSLRQLSVAGPLALQVSALGPLIVRRDGVEIVRWGGPKAGNRQALAIFAFLLDRGDRGAHRSEIVDLIWPEFDLVQADLAFHRTLVGLRRVLAAPEPAAVRSVITTRTGVYRLDPALVVSSDVDEFEEHLTAIETGADPAVMEAHLVAARRLYRGDYMDDCPLYGDSSHVEVRRQLLRDRLISALQIVAEARERAGNSAAAGQLFRDALEVGGTPMPGEVLAPRLINPAA